MTEADFTPGRVEEFLNAIEHPTRRADGFTLLKMMREITGVEPALWGPTMVGFGVYQYRTKSGFEGECLTIGFSPRKASLSLYGPIYEGSNLALLEKLGKYKTGKSCLYINKLDDVDLEVLREMLRESWHYHTVVETTGAGC